MKRSVLIVGLIGLAACLAASCGSEYPDESEGGRILGTLVYSGVQHENLALPAVGAYAFASWPPQGPPHASVITENPQALDAGISYELANLVPGEYMVLAQIVDLSIAEPDPVAAGGYPDYCSFGTSPVTVLEQGPVEAVDIELFDDAGQEDPCVDPDQEIQPLPGKASLVVDVIGPDGYEPDDVDNMSVTLFSSWPPTGPPLAMSQVAGDEIDLPQRIINNRVTPDTYAVAICLDLGGDNMMCDGEGDKYQAFGNGTLVDFAEAQIVFVEANLQTGETTLTGD